MTSYAKDPSTGKPLFRDSDAPDVKQDPQEAADFAAEVGNMIVGTTAYLANYQYQREGLEGYDTTLKAKMRCDGDGWHRIEPRRGQWSGDTDNQGLVTIEHGLGYTPTNIQISNGPVAGFPEANTRLFTPTIWDRGPASFRVRYRREDDNTWVNGAQVVAFQWQAI